MSSPHTKVYKNLMIKNRIAFLALIIIQFFVAEESYIAHAQDSDTDLKSQDVQTTIDLEEITVVGERSFFAIRFQIREAEDGLYAMFNELNSNDDFDIECKVIRSTKSHIPRRRCEPMFLTKARQANSTMSLMFLRDALTTGAEVSSDAVFDIGAGVASWQDGLSLVEDERGLREIEETNFEALNEEMFTIASKNEEFLRLMIELETLKKEYEAKRQQRFGD